LRDVVVVDYDPAWADAFGRIREFLAPAVSKHAVAIEHVGSTSVAGLAAKPIIDVDIVVANPKASRAAIAAMEAIGFEHRGDLGVPGREAFTKHPDLPPANIYVVLQASTAYRNHIQLRNYLRAHPNAATEYGALKKELAMRFPNDIDGYIDGKTDFIVNLLQLAGLEAEELKSVEKINKQQR
jgi:GrpB-like predicted nucleotidyltransferase (UPF0157 family)